MRLVQRCWLVVALCLCTFWGSGCFVARVQVGPAFVTPVKNVRKTVTLPQQPEDTHYGFGFDFLMAIHVPLLNAVDLFTNTKVTRKKRSPFGVSVDLGPGLWMAAEMGYSLDTASFPGKFVAGLGLSYRLGEHLAIGYTPYLMLAGSENGIHIGMRHSLTIYLFYSILFIEPQVEFSFATGFTRNFRIMAGFNLMAPFIILARRNL